MKLRNKKTDAVANYRIILQRETGNGSNKAPIKYVCGTLTKLNEEWEDYKSAEPLIDDEKIRKAVKYWADVNNISKATCKEEMHCVTFETERGMFVSFENADPIPPEGTYTIAELCGEEEECES